MPDIRGFIETSLIDWDGKIVSIAFVGGCNFRCPFCHNALLVTAPQALEPISTEKIKSFMLERKNFIDGLVITGGEPCQFKDLPDFIGEIKALGFLVKLDTNGTNPEMLKRLIKKTPGVHSGHQSVATALVDYVAMDIKAPFYENKYLRAVGFSNGTFTPEPTITPAPTITPDSIASASVAKLNLEKIKQSANLLLTQSAGSIDYEFRLTVVPGLVDENDIEVIGQQLKGAKKFALQQFVPQNCLDKTFAQIKPFSKEVLLSFQLTLKQYINNTIIRGA